MDFGPVGIAGDALVKAEPAESGGAEPGGAAGARCGELEPSGPFADESAIHPVGAAAGGEPEGEVGGRRIGGVDGPREGAADVIEIGFEAIEPLASVGADLMSGDRLGQGGEEGGVGVAGGLGFGVGGEAVGGVGADCLEHEEARFTVWTILAVNEAMVEECRYAIQDRGVSHQTRGDRFEGCTTGEDGEIAKERLVLGGKEIVGPGDSGAHGLVAVGGVLGAAGEDLEAVGEAGEEGAGREEFRASGGELDGKGQAIEAGANLGDCVGDFGGEGQVRLDGAGAVEEEGDRGWGGEWGDGPFVLGGEAEADAAGGEDSQPGAGRQKGRDDRGDAGEMFEVVKDEKAGAGAEEVGEGVEGRAAGVFADTEGLGDGGWD